MKKLIIVTALAAIFLIQPLRSKAQERPNVIRINPLSLVVGNVSLFYERAFNENMSGVLGGNYMFISIGDNVKVNGIGITPELRFYMSDEKEAPNGVYIGPWMRLRNFVATEEIQDPLDPTIVYSSKADFTNLAVGGLFGYQKIFNSDFSFDLFIGPYYSSSTVKLRDNSTGADEPDLGTFGNTGVWFRSGFSLGYAF